MFGLVLARPSQNKLIWFKACVFVCCGVETKSSTYYLICILATSSGKCILIKCSISMLLFFLFFLTTEENVTHSWMTLLYSRLSIIGDDQESRRRAGFESSDTAFHPSRLFNRFYWSRACNRLMLKLLLRPLLLMSWKTYLFEIQSNIELI